MRRYVRYHAGIPVEIVESKTETSLDYPRLHNVSLGGIECECEKHFPVDTLVQVHIDILRPPFTVEGRVVWCKKVDSYSIFGIQFFGEMDTARLRVVEQISHIEHYRKEIREQEGRTLTGEEAAKEWIELYAPHFP